VEYTTLRITRSLPGSEAKNRVLLEQERWDPYIGMLTKGGVVAYLHDLLFGEGDGVEENCGVNEDGSVSGNVFAYPDPPDLNYSAKISHGVLGPRVVAELEYAELLQIQKITEPALRYPTSEILSAEWVTDAFAVDGEVLPRPAVDISGNRPRIAEQVYGTLLVIYRVVRHAYSVTIYPRPEAAENKYQSYIYALWDGGNNFIEYNPPPTVLDGGRCNSGGGGSVTVVPPDCEPAPPQPEDLHYDVDYCDGTVTKS